jgi:hypothetical protein
LIRTALGVDDNNATIGYDESRIRPPFGAATGVAGNQIDVTRQRDDGKCGRLRKKRDERDERDQANRTSAD